MNIQYYHGTKEKGYLQEFTVAINVPDKDPFLDFLAMTLDDPMIEIEMDVGITKVSPKDAYVRSVGREQSVAKMQTMNFKVAGLHYIDNHRYKVVLTSNTLSIVVQISSKGEKVHFISIYENE